MADPVSAPKQFTTVMYTTKDGEQVCATKNNGVVTLVGNKNGTRQMPLEEFKNELLTNCSNIQLEKTPAKDTVEISKAETPAADPAVDLEVKTADEALLGICIKDSESGKKLDVAA